ncbi:hypothetical protein Daus18300_013624 [Diaporthe australafricana]|uniref:Uncharacterized protein n=1 Tax=Diaporthe australafricana TaxID=127596 RepID=A0ABR3VYA3_9PEZI
MADDAHSFAELLSYALNDLSWAGVHVLAGLSHVGLFLVGLIGFVFSPADLDDVVNGRVPFGLTAKLPWAANALGMIGAFVNFALYASLIKVNQITTLDFPRQLYHKRQVIILSGLTALSILCIGDLALALNLAAAAQRYELLSASFWTICVIATIAA